VVVHGGAQPSVATFQPMAMVMVPIARASESVGRLRLLTADIIHLSGTAAGSQFGVAKAANIIAFSIANSSGSYADMCVR